MTFWTAVLPVATLILGWMGSTFVEGRRYRRRAARARQERLEQRREAQTEQRRQFELATLSDTHGALSRLARAAARVHLLDLTLARTSGTYGPHQLANDELDEEHQLAALEVSRLAGVVLDDEIRQWVTDAHDAVLGVPMGQKTVGEAESQFDRAFGKVDVAQCACARRIRELYNSDVD